MTSGGGQIAHNYELTISGERTLETEDIVVTHGPFVMTKTGVYVVKPAKFDEWFAVFDWCQQASGAIQFWLGDLLEYGEKNYGEKYTQALETTGYAAQTLMNATYVARNVHKSVRNDNLSFAHHAEVAPLDPPEQQRWLKKAEDEQLTRQELRDSIRKERAIEAGKPITLWVVVSCEGAEDQRALYNRMISEGRNVRLSIRDPFGGEPTIEKEQES